MVDSKEETTIEGTILEDEDVELERTVDGENSISSDDQDTGGQSAHLHQGAHRQCSSDGGRGVAGEGGSIDGGGCGKSDAAASGGCGKSDTASGESDGHGSASGGCDKSDDGGRGSSDDGGRGKSGDGGRGSSDDGDDSGSLGLEEGVKALSVASSSSEEQLPTRK